MINNISEINNKPVVGFLTLALSDFLGHDFGLKNKRAKSFLSSAYTRWIENCGARVVPIDYTLNTPVLKSYLSQLNGVIICGNIILDNYIKNNKNIKLDQNYIRWLYAGYTIFQWAKQQNDIGTFFPILGIGRGYLNLILMHNRDTNYTYDDTVTTIIDLKEDDLVKGDDVYFSTPFKLTNTAGIFGKNISNTDQKLFATNNVCYNTPGWLINIKGPTSGKMKEFIEINSIAKSKVTSQHFINAYSFKEYPFYGMAFHPEMINYRRVRYEPVSEVDVSFSRQMAELFVNECRKNSSELKTNSILIYNYTLYSPQNIIKILYPKNNNILKLKKQFVNSYFFGQLKHVHKTKKNKQKTNKRKTKKTPIRDE